MRSMIKVLFLLAAFGAGLARAQSIRWEPASGTLGVGQASELQLILDGCSVDNPPALPHIDGLSFQFGGKSTSTTIINGSFSSLVSLTYEVLLSKKHAIDIPSFTVQTNKGLITVPPAHFEAGDATVGSSGLSIDQVASARLSTTPLSVWAGQVFDVAYSIDVDASYYPDWGQIAWDPAPLVAEDWQPAERFETNGGAAVRNGIATKTRAIARTAGQLQIAAPRQLINLRIGVTGFGFFQQRQIQQFSITGSAPSIEIKPLPPGPAGFSGAVGQFKISSKVVPQKVSVGDPITWTIELKGAGNWPDIQGLPSREVSKDFQVVQPKAKRALATGKLFDATLTEDVVLISTKPGTYVLGSLTFVYFDPRKGAYQQVQTAPTTVTVTPNAAAPAAVTSAAPNAQAGAGPSAPAAQAPEAPGAIPRDPLPGGASADAPLRPVVLAAASAAVAVLVALFWAGLAWRRAKRTDRELARRQARSRVFTGLAALERAPAAERPALLRLWQQDTAIVLSLSGAAPAHGDIAHAEWSQLWREADRAIYGEAHELPADWIARARAAYAQTPVPAFSPLQLFLPRNLFPFFLLLLLAGASLARADEGGSAYRGGEFAKAEKLWKQQLAEAPLDWQNRYNLSLALAQQDHWGEAAAEATAAFVQHPSDQAVRWQFALACEKAQLSPTAVGDFLQPSPSESFARIQSAPEWQRIFLIGVAVFGLGLALLLACAYGAAPRRAGHAVALLCLALGLAAAAVAWGGVRAYGISADARAVMVWRAGTLRSVPTEAEVTQKTSTLPAGTVAVIDGQFLSWVRLRFEDGQTGWVRGDEIIPLWR